MHRNGPKIISCYPQFSGSKFPCDSRGGLRFTERRRLAGLLDLNMRHTTGKKSFLNTDRLAVTGARNLASLFMRYKFKVLDISKKYSTKLRGLQCKREISGSCDKLVCPYSEMTFFLYYASWLGLKVQLNDVLRQNEDHHENHKEILNHKIGDNKK